MSLRLTGSLGRWRRPPVQRTRGLVVCVLGDGTAGAEKQCLALGEALEAKDVRMVRPRLRRGWSVLPPAAHCGLARVVGCPWLGVDRSSLSGIGVTGAGMPDVIVASGRRTVPASVAIRRAHPPGSVYTVQIQAPRCDPGLFDLIVTPEHDRAAFTGPCPPANVMFTAGALHSVTPGMLEEQLAGGSWHEEFMAMPRPRLALLVGDRPVHDLAYAVGCAAGQVAARGGSIIATTSRRTSAEGTRCVAGALRSAGCEWYLYHPPGDSRPNPYFSILAAADVVMVTADSVSMVSEAIGSRKPVIVDDPAAPALRPKMQRFHQHLIRQAYTHSLASAPWDTLLSGRRPPSGPPLDVDVVAARVRQDLETRHKILPGAENNNY